jgi:hypothetical protein
MERRDRTAEVPDEADPAGTRICPSAYRDRPKRVCREGVDAGCRAFAFKPNHDRGPERTHASRGLGSPMCTTFGTA